LPDSSWAAVRTAILVAVIGGVVHAGRHNASPSGSAEIRVRIHTTRKRGVGGAVHKKAVVYVTGVAVQRVHAGIAGGADAGDGTSLHGDRIVIQHAHEPSRLRVSNHYFNEVWVASFRPVQRRRVNVDRDVGRAIGEAVEGCVFLGCRS